MLRVAFQASSWLWKSMMSASCPRRERSGPQEIRDASVPSGSGVAGACERDIVRVGLMGRAKTAALRREHGFAGSYLYGTLRTIGQNRPPQATVPLMFVLGEVA